MILNFKVVARYLGMLTFVLSMLILAVGLFAGAQRLIGSIG